jgi:hypothetical protein
MGTEKTALLNALEEYERAKKKYGVTSAQAMKWMGTMLALAPDDVKEKIVDEGIRQGVLPKPDGYLADGTPVYSSRLIEDFFGVSRDEIGRRIQILNEARQSVGKDALPFYDDSVAHKVQ